MKKKKEIPMPKIYRTAELTAKVKVYIVVAIILAAAGLFSFFYWASNNSKESESVEYIQKGVVNKYVCRIIGAEPEAEMVAVECLTK